ncbi:unnamed protein product [Sphagnum balticum]
MAEMENSIPYHLSNRRTVHRFAQQPRDEWRLKINQTYFMTREITDINATGLSFRASSSIHFDPGQSIDLEVSLKPGHSFRCKGEVVGLALAVAHAPGLQVVRVRFEKLPSWLDSQVTALLQQRLLHETIHSGLLSNGDRASDILWRPVELLVAAAMFLALTTAVWYYDRGHPAKSIERIFNQGLAQRLDQGAK